MDCRRRRKAFHGSLDVQNLIQCPHETKSVLAPLARDAREVIGLTSWLQWDLEIA